MTQVTPAPETPDYQVTPEQMTFSQQIAEEITRRGFQEPALLALAAGPLFTFLGSQILWVAQPALSLFIPAPKIRQTAALLESPEALSALARYLQTSPGTKEG